MPPEFHRRSAESALLLSFALSGLSALLAQTVWQRELSRLIGATTPASALVFGGVMAGLAAGSLLGNSLANRANNAVRFFALLEVLTAGIAFVYVLALTSGALYSASSSTGLLGDEIVRRSFAFALVLLPSILMGATWPATVSAAPKMASKLYAANLGGAFLGAIGGAFCLVPNFGLVWTLGAAGFLNLAAAMAALAVSSSFAVRASDKIEPVETTETAESSAQTIKDEAEHSDILDVDLPFFDCLVVFVMAVVMLSLEVLWTRLFTLVLGSSVYSVGLVLAGSLAGLFIGASAVSRLSAKAKYSQHLLISILLVSAVVVALQAYFLNDLPFVFLSVTEKLLALNFGQFEQFLYSRIFITFACVLVPSAIIGCAFPLVLARNSDDDEKHRKASWLYSISAVGSVVGSLCTGLILLSAFGVRFQSGFQAVFISLSIFILATVLMVILPLVYQKNAKVDTINRPLPVAYLVIFVMIFHGMSKPDLYLLSSGLSFVSAKELLDAKMDLSQFIEQEKKIAPIKYYKEGVNTTVTVCENSTANLRILKNDGKVEASIPIDLSKPAPASDYFTQTLLADLPYLLSHEANTKALVIGAGSGTTYSALSENLADGKVTVAEIENYVYQAGTKFTNISGAQNPGIEKLVCDARSHLAFDGITYNMIVSQPAEPWVNGASDLYTKEFFSLVSERLSINGVFCQWLQLYSIDEKHLSIILNTISSVFPSTFIFHPHGSGEILILSFKGNSAESKINLSSLGKLLTDPSVTSHLRRSGVNSLPDFLSMLVLTPQSLDRFIWKTLGNDRTMINTDNNLLTEYALPLHLNEKEERIEKNLSLLHSAQSEIASAFTSMPEDPEAKSEILDQIAFSMAKFSQHYPGECLDDAALAVAYEAWNVKNSPSTAQACDVIASMTGRLRENNSKLAGSESLETADGPYFFWTAQKYLQQGNYAGVVTLLSATSRRNFENKSELLLLLGQALIKEAKFEQAVSTLKSATRDLSTRQQALSLTAIAQYHQSNFEASAHNAEQALAIRPDDYLSRFYLAKAMFSSKNPDQALNEMQWASKASPLRLQPRVWMCCAQILNGQEILAARNFANLKTKGVKMREIDLLKSYFSRRSPDSGEQTGSDSSHAAIIDAVENMEP